MPDGGTGSRLSEIALERALVDVEDLFSRVLVPFYLLGETGKSIVDKGPLSGEFLDIGVKKADMTEFATTTIKNFALQDFKEDEKGFSYVAHGVPIKVKYIKRKYSFFSNPDSVFYRAAEYLIPNPFDRYWTARHIIQ